MSNSSIPAWGNADLPEPKPLSWRNWSSFVGPGIVMMGIQIGGGEWLFGPEVTTRYGGGLMWIATIAIVLQVFYNIECGRYALFCGEPIMTGFMRTGPGPRFWIGLILLLNLSALIPGLSTTAAAVIAALVLDRPPGIGDQVLVTRLAYVCLFVVVLPVLVGGKVYNMLQWVMTAKVAVVLTFCLAIGLALVSPQHWWDVASGFVEFGNVPTVDEQGRDTVTNAVGHYFDSGDWPLIALGNIAVLGAFAGYAGGGGLSNSTYSNFVRDKGWGMGSQVGAIASAIGGNQIALSHVGKVFPIDAERIARWKGWWRYILTDQVLVWAPGCFMGMALPALLSMQFAEHSPIYHQKDRLEFAQAMITADGMRHAPQFSATAQQAMWVATLLVGLMVLLPSQMSIVDDFSRRWTDVLWTSSRRIRTNLGEHQVKYVYYTILTLYVWWSFVALWLFNTYGTPKLMVLVIANLNNLAIGLTALHLLWVDRTLLPPALRPRWYHQLGVAACSAFYLGLAGLVFVTKQWPALRAWLDR